MNGFGRDAAHHQFIRQGCRLGAGAGKDQRALDRLDLEETRQGIGLVRFVDEVVALFSRCKGKRRAFNGDRLRVTHEAIRQGADARRQGRGK